MAWLEADFEDALDFQLFGLTSVVGSHRLCWELNRALGWGLTYYRTLGLPESSRKMDPDEGSEPPAFVAHRYHRPQLGWDVTLVLNRAERKVLVEKLPRVDYLLRVGECAHDLEPLPTLLKQLPSVTWATSLDVMKTGAWETMGLLDVRKD